MSKDKLSNIAQRCGCSVSTVSRVLSGKAEKGRISKATAERILFEAKKSDYVPDIVAKSLRTGRTRTIGLIIPGVDDLFFSEIASRIVREARQSGYNVLLLDTQEDKSNEISCIREMIARKVDGIIISPCGDDRDAFGIPSAYGKPIIQIDRYIPSCEGVSYVTTDNYEGAVTAVEHLIAKGHKEILCVAGDSGITTCSERMRGYRDTMEKHALTPHIIGDSFSSERSRELMTAELEQRRGFSAVFTLSNKLLTGVLPAIRDAGLGIPQDLSVISFDDNPLFDVMKPSISCIAQPVDTICSTALKLILEEMAGTKTPSRTLLAPKLVARESVKDISE